VARHAAIVTRIRFEFDEYALPVEYRRLGGTDLELSSIVLGCGNFGGIGSAPELFGRGENEAEAFAIMDRAVAAGINVFDTAASYGGGRSESWIGSWRRQRDASVLLSTKVYWSVTGDPADRGLSRERIVGELAGSLSRLQADRVDMYLTHEPDPETPVEETFATFAALTERGLIDAWGISNVTADDLRRWLALGTPSLVQNSYSLLDRADEQEVIPLCEEHGIEYQAFSPLAGGWLTGKYRRDQEPPPGSRMTLRPEPYRHLDSEQVHTGIERLAEAAATRGVSTAALALAWALGRVGSVVVGPRRPDHLENVHEALSLSLSEAELGEVGSFF